MNRYGSTRDVSMTVRIATPTGPHLLLALCGHKTSRVGAQMRGNIVIRCPACRAKGAA